MNFIIAIQHATIGYGIRRKSWAGEAILSVDNSGELHWLPRGPSQHDSEGEPARPCPLSGGSYGLDARDMAANDWETI